jgi:hypothetical protein
MNVNNRRAPVHMTRDQWVRLSMDGRKTAVERLDFQNAIIIEDAASIETMAALFTAIGGK